MSEFEEWQGERSRVPQGNYNLLCLSAKRTVIGLEGKGGWGRVEKIVLWFQIVDDGDYIGKIIPAFLAVPDSKVSMSTKFYQFWVIANGFKRPGRNRLKDMALTKFIDKIFLASVVDSKSKYPDGTTKPDVFQYSRVDYLKDLIAGNTES